MFSIKSRRPILICLGLCLAMCLGLGLGYLTSHVFSEDAKFQKFTETLFQAEVSGSTLNLHYTLAHPEQYQISSDKITLGEVPLDPQSTYTQMENYEKTLQSFSYDDLSEENQLTLDLLL